MAKVSKAAREYVTIVSAGFPDSRVQNGSTLHFIDAEPGFDDKYVFFNGMWNVVRTANV